MIWLLILFFIFSGSRPSTDVAHSGHRDTQQFSSDSQQASDIYNLISHYMIWVLILFFLFPGSTSTGVSQSGHQQLSCDSRQAPGIH